MDPALAQALASLIGVITVAVLAIVQYYFPRGYNRFDQDGDGKPDKKSDHDKPRFDDPADYD